MKKLPLAIFLLVSCVLFLHVPTTCFAIDDDGCLTCHKYPGLVRFDKPEGSKVLHIDEQKYLGSPHGKLACTTCHTGIVKVPHTGETKVECTTKCHLSEKEKRSIQNYPLATHHDREQAFITNLQDESSCRVCHSLYPHSKDRLVRGFLNMHTGFMFCEACHIKRDSFPHLSYQWKDSENAEFSGEPYGTYYNPRTKRTRKPANFISRIAVFMKKKGHQQLVMNTQDNKGAHEFLSDKQSLTPDEKKKRLRYFHRDVARKKISVACDECHSSNSILDFQKLGFDEKRTKNLIHLNIKGLVTKYKTFYFPDLFRD